MAKKKTGISLELITHPGEILQESLEGHNMSQAELANRTGFTEAFISNVIAGKKDISANFAKALEYVLGTSSGLWLGLQAEYDEEMADYKDEHSVSKEEIKKYHEMKEVKNVLKDKIVFDNDTEGVISMRQALRINNLNNLNAVMPDGLFRLDRSQKYDPYILGAWILMCKNEDESIYEAEELDIDSMVSLIHRLKNIMLSNKKDIATAVKKLLYDFGIEFTVMPLFKSAPVQGYLSLNKDGVYHVFITLKDDSPETFWLSLFHELGHLFCKDVTVNKKFVDLGIDEKKEARAEKLANDLLLPPKAYKAFVKKNDFSKKAIKAYAKSQFVREYIVIDRLKKDHLIK